MKKNKYVKPSIRLFVCTDNKILLMAASGKYGIDVDGEPVIDKVTEGNPDEIDAKKKSSIWDSWDE